MLWDSPIGRQPLTEYCVYAKIVWLKLRSCTLDTSYYVSHLTDIFMLRGKLHRVPNT